MSFFLLPTRCSLGIPGTLSSCLPPTGRLFSYLLRFVQLGLGVAVDYALGWGVDSIWARVRMLADTLRCRLRAVPGVTVHDIGAVQCGIVTFTCDAEPADAIQQRLAAAGVHVSVTAPETTVLDAARRGLPALCTRLSGSRVFHLFYFPHFPHVRLL